MYNNARINTAIEDMRHSLNIMYVLLRQNMPKKCGDPTVDSSIDKTNQQLDYAVQNFHNAEKEIRAVIQDNSTKERKINK